MILSNVRTDSQLDEISLLSYLSTVCISERFGICEDLTFGRLKHMAEIDVLRYQKVHRNIR